MSNCRLNSATKSHEANRVVVEHGDVAGGLVGDVHLVPLVDQPDERAAHRDHVVVRVRREDEHALGEDRRRRSAACRRRCLAWAGLPPGQPVIVACRSRNTSMLMSYAGPGSASRSCRPSSL